MTITDDGAGNITFDATGGGGTVNSVNSGININVDNTDPANPIVNSLSDRYKTSSTTSNSVSNGTKTFTVDANLSYIPLQEVLVVHNSTNNMHGEVVSYSGTTLVVDIKTHTGSGTYTSWVINLDGTPVDALTGSGTPNEIAYFNSPSVLASLPVSIYPSLTELSYVKGLTSSAQTQINGKQNSLTTTKSVKIISDNVELDGDDATPGNLKYYGTDSGGTKGFHSFPSGNYAVVAISTAGGTPITGTTANSISASALVLANTFSVGNVIRITWGTSKVGTGGTYVARLYVNSTNSLTGAIFIAQFDTSGSATTRILQMARHLRVRNTTTNTQHWPTTVTIASDLTSSTTGVGYTASAINHTVDEYYIFALQNTVNGDSTVVDWFMIERL